jgi:hypothetical protein
MEARMTSEKLHKIVIWVAAHEDIVELAAKVRDKRMVYRPITEEHRHWGRVIEQRMLRTTTVDLVSGEILEQDAPCVLGESYQCGCDYGCCCNGDQIANSCCCTPCLICGLCNTFVNATGSTAAATKHGATAQWGNATGTIAAGMPTTTTRNALVPEKGRDTRDPLPRSSSGCSEETVVIEAFALRAFAHLN